MVEENKSNQPAETALTLIISAAGSGKRFGGEVPKPLVKLAGKPILWHTLKSFITFDELKEIIIARHPDYDDDILKIAEIIPPHIAFKQVDGGAERQDSIFNALNQVDEKTTLVAVHDAVRPFPAKSAVKKTIKVAMKYGAALMGHQPRDTIKQMGKDGILVDKTLNRASLIQCQTPQIFQFNLLKEVNEKAGRQNWKVTDDASMVEIAGYEVRVVEGNTDNIKITYPHDLLVAESILKTRVSS